MHIIHGRQLDLNLIIAFDALIREGSVTRAADQLGITQSAMSHALRRLRGFFNDPLFVKVGDRMKPTPKAEQLSPAVLSVMGTVRTELLSLASFEAASARRTFNLCMTDMGELVFLPPLIDRLRELAPHCRLRTMQVPTEQVAATLESGTADLALGSLQVPGGLFQQDLFLHSFATIVSARNEEIGETLSLAEFTRMQHVVVTLSGKTEAYDRAIEERGIKRDIYLATPHFLVVPHILERNPQMISTVPWELARVFEKYGGVRVLRPPLELPRFSLRQHWHPRYHHDEANVWLRHLIKETFRNYPKGMAEPPPWMLDSA